MSDWGSLSGLDIVEQVDDISHSLKSAEEIEKYSVDEELADDARIILLLTKSVKQRVSSVRQIPSLTQSLGCGLLERALPKIEAILKTADATGELHIAVAEAFASLIERGVLTKQLFAEKIIPLSLSMIDARSDEVVAAWMDTIFNGVSVAPKAALQTVMETALAKADLSQPVHSRVIACKLFGALAKRFDAAAINSGFLSVALSLCQDTDYDVRMTMCEQLDPIARGIGLPSAEKELFEELMQLFGDEESVVRNAAIRTSAKLLDFFSPALRRSNIVPRVIRFYQEAQPAMNATLAEYLGVFLVSSIDQLDEAEGDVVANYFTKTATSADESLRRWCAYNFPAVAKCFGAEKYASTLHRPHAELARDSKDSVRKTIAACLHEVSRIVGCEVAERHCRPLCMAFLRDPTPDVTHALMPNLDACFAAFMAAGRDAKRSTFGDFSVPLLQYYKSVSHTWRLASTTLDQFENFTRYFTSDQVYNQFVPVLFEALTMNAANPVKLSAGRILCIFVRKVRKAAIRYELCQRIITEFCRGRSYWHRTGFVDLCSIIQGMFSRAFFKKNFFESFLEVAQDPVVGVRLKACAVIPQCKKMLKLPLDQYLLRKLEDVAAHLQSDPDKEVARRASEAVAQLSAIKLVPVVRSGLAPQFEDDLIDRKREEEEELINQLEEQDEPEVRRAGGPSAGLADDRSRADAKGVKARPPIGSKTGPYAPAPAPAAADKGKGPAAAKAAPPSATPAAKGKRTTVTAPAPAPAARLPGPAAALGPAAARPALNGSGGPAPAPAPAMPARTASAGSLPPAAAAPKGVKSKIDSGLKKPSASAPAPAPAKGTAKAPPPGRR